MLTCFLPKGKVKTQVHAEMRCKIHTGAGANLMLLDDYKNVNPSDFNDLGNSLAGYSHDRTSLKAYGGMTAMTEQL